MKKARLLLFVLPLIMGAFYLRSLASWRPKVVFQGETQREAVSQLEFSPDGQTLLVGTGQNSWVPENLGVLTSVSALIQGLISLRGGNGKGAKGSFESGAISNTTRTLPTFFWMGQCKSGKPKRVRFSSTRNTIN